MPDGDRTFSCSLRCCVICWEVQFKSKERQTQRSNSFSQARDSTTGSDSVIEAGGRKFRAKHAATLQIQGFRWERTFR
jgi:hypothetical protein